MPELPEVETVRRVLAPRLLNRTITEVRIRNAQVVASPAPEEFASRLTGRTIAEFGRRGKFLRLVFADGGSLTLHLRMTGCLTIASPELPYEKHTHLIFALDDGCELRYEDVRRFGRFRYAEKGERDTSGAEKLGVEPFDARLTARYLEDKCGGSRKSVKEMLLDQRIVAGIGNIYSDEILFAAGIRPDKACAALAEEEFARLAATIPERLSFFIGKNAVSFEEYNAGKGRDYRNTPYLRVYGKADAPCPVCGGRLQRAVVGGRSSVFCADCQK